MSPASLPRALATGGLVYAFALLAPPSTSYVARRSAAARIDSTRLPPPREVVRSLFASAATTARDGEQLVNVVFQFLHHVPMPEAMREALTHAKAAVDQRDFWLSILVFAVVLRLLGRTRVPKIVVKHGRGRTESTGVLDAGAPFPSDSVPCYDPGNIRVLDRTYAAMTADEVRERIARAAAQKQWAKGSFETRRTLLRVIPGFILRSKIPSVE